MCAPHAVDIAVIISSLIASICFTFAEPFDDIFLFVKSSCALVSGNTNKSLRSKEGSTDRPTDQASEFAVAHLTPILHFCKIIVKTSKCSFKHCPATKAESRNACKISNPGDLLWCRLSNIFQKIDN